MTHPKPVKAWAVVNPTEGLFGCTVEPTRELAELNCGVAMREGETVIPVLIVPADGYEVTPKAVDNPLFVEKEAKK